MESEESEESEEEEPGRNRERAAATERREGERLRQRRRGLGEDGSRAVGEGGVAEAVRCIMTGPRGKRDWGEDGSGGERARQSPASADETGKRAAPPRQSNVRPRKAGMTDW